MNQPPEPKVIDLAERRAVRASDRYPADEWEVRRAAKEALEDDNWRQIQEREAKGKHQTPKD
jgi:hypothetical protein